MWFHHEKYVSDSGILMERSPAARGEPAHRHLPSTLRRAAGLGIAMPSLALLSFLHGSDRLYVFPPFHVPPVLPANNDSNQHHLAARPATVGSELSRCVVPASFTRFLALTPPTCIEPFIPACDISFRRAARVFHESI